LKWIVAGIWVSTLVLFIGVGYQLGARNSEEHSEPEFDVATRLSETLSERDMLTRTFNLSELLQFLDAGNVTQAAEVLEARRIGVTAFEVRLFMSSWCRFDPEGAFAWADAWRGPWRNTLSNAAVYAWAYHDPEGAADAFATLDGARRGELRASLIAGWARSGDTTGLTDHLFSRPAGKERSRFIGVLLAELIQREDGPGRIRVWAESVPLDAPHQARETAFLTAGGALAQNDPTNAVVLYEAHKDSEYAHPALRTIARRWVEFHDPPALFEWLVTLPPGQARDDAIEAGFKRWWTQSPAAARTWLIESPLDAPLDPAVAVMAIAVSRSSPRKAISWADGIHDPEMRRRTLIPILRLWIADDRRAARAWMGEHSVPSEIQRELLK
jgi:hypothetical protein